MDVPRKRSFSEDKLVDDSPSGEPVAKRTTTLQNGEPRLQNVGRVNIDEVGHTGPVILVVV
jgi:hypothetical protein